MNSSIDVTSPRLVLVDTDSGRLAWVKQNLDLLGYEVCGVTTDPSRLLKTVTDAAPDLLLIDWESPSAALLESLKLVAQYTPTPIVMFSAEEDPQVIAQAVAAGVATYLVGNIDLLRVKPVIDTALAQFQRYRSLQGELEEVRSELDERRVVDRAKHLVMEFLSCSEQEAYAYIRAEAMNSGRRMKEVAEAVLEQQDKPQHAPN